MEKKQNPRREELKILSAPLRILLREGAIKTINKALKDIYQKQGHSTLKTIRQWNHDGKFVKKGEKAFLLWGRPKKIVIQKAKEKGVSDEELMNFFPVCYVFSELQVH